MFRIVSYLFSRTSLLTVSQAYWRSKIIRLYIIGRKKFWLANVSSYFFTQQSFVKVDNLYLFYICSLSLYFISIYFISVKHVDNVFFNLRDTFYHLTSYVCVWMLFNVFSTFCIIQQNSLHSIFFSIFFSFCVYRRKHIYCIIYNIYILYTLHTYTYIYIYNLYIGKWEWWWRMLWRNCTQIVWSNQKSFIK